MINLKPQGINVILIPVQNVLDQTQYLLAVSVAVYLKARGLTPTLLPLPAGIKYLGIKVSQILY